MHEQLTELPEGAGCGGHAAPATRLHFFSNAKLEESAVPWSAALIVGDPHPTAEMSLAEMNRQGIVGLYVEVGTTPEPGRRHINALAAGVRIVSGEPR